MLFYICNKQKQKIMKIPFLSPITRPINQSVLLDATNYSLQQKHSVFKFTVAQEKERIHKLIHWIKSRNRSDFIIAAGFCTSFAIVILLGLTAVFLLPKNHVYSYAGDNCFFNPVAFPDSLDYVGSDNYKATLYPTLTLGKTPLFSTNTCVEIAKIPDTQSAVALTLKSPLPISKNISLTSNSLPNLTKINDLEKPVSTDAVLLFTIDQTDKTFEYNLVISDNVTDCVINANLVGCPLKDQKLNQGQTYQYSLQRILGNESSVAVNSSITTLDPVTITASDVQQNEVVYSILTSISLATNKPIKSLDGLALKSESDKALIPVSAKISDSSITVTIPTELARNTNYTLLIESIESNDGARLSEPYILAFKTSAGPQVQGINISSYKVSPSATVTISFDIELDPNQAIESSISINSSSGSVPYSATIQNNVVTLRPNTNLARCTSYTISINDELKNKFGVGGNTSWSTQFRTICQESFSIGSSVQGRSITGYRFGTGAKKILIVGGMHGDEKSSVSTLISFIDDLERNSSTIPVDKTVVVIPNSNPDGYIASTRVNANIVDLNRNFPTFDWTSGVYMPRNIFLEMGGGATPLSEPESAALASYTAALSPRVVLTFHATGRAVFANDAGDSKAIADIYAEKSGFTSYSDSDASSFFSYPTTGEYEDWIRDKLNLPALLVELATVSNNEYGRQKSALWAMLSL
jgi:murein peptide amidase A